MCKTMESGEPKPPFRLPQSTVVMWAESYEAERYDDHTQTTSALVSGCISWCVSRCQLYRQDADVRWHSTTGLLLSVR